jgi:hypothetical protein
MNLKNDSVHFKLSQLTLTDGLKPWSKLFINSHGLKAMVIDIVLIMDLVQCDNLKYTRMTFTLIEVHLHCNHEFPCIWDKK